MVQEVRKDILCISSKRYAGILRKVQKGNGMVEADGFITRDEDVTIERKHNSTRTLTALIEEMNKMVDVINVNEIADHLNEESLFNWCGAWRQDAREILQEMKSL